VRKMTDDYEIVKGATESMFGTMKEGLSNVLVAAFQGDTKKMKDTWNDFIQTLKNTFLKMIADLITKKLLSGMFGGMIGEDKKNIADKGAEAIKGLKDVSFGGSNNAANILGIAQIGNPVFGGGFFGGLSGGTQATTGATVAAAQGEDLASGFDNAMTDMISSEKEALASSMEGLSNDFSMLGDDSIGLGDSMNQTIEQMSASATLEQAFMSLATAADSAAFALQNMSGGSSGEGGGGFFDMLFGGGADGGGSSSLESAALDWSDIGLADGGIVSAPTLALIGEGQNNEAVVPMPNGKGIPVDMKNNNTAQSQAIEVTVVNLINDDAINAAITRKPNTVINVIDSNINSNGSTARLIDNRKRR
nr:hypothetical protein [Clostridia bacterium]